MNFCLCVLLAFLSSASIAETLSWQADFESYLDSVIKEYNIPGIAVEVVGRDGPIFQVTRGFRDKSRQLPVTSQTLFAIGSTSKAFTGVLLAQLRDKKQVDFDSPVQKYWPSFTIADPNASASLTVHDLTSHFTGVGRHDFAWVAREGLTQAEALKLIPLLPISAPAHTTFIYNNWMLMAIGHLEELISGQSYESLLQTQLFHTLGMHASNTSLTVTQASADYSLPYQVDERFNVTQTSFLDLSAFNPAGGIFSNLEDMAKWVQMHLNHGLVNGQAIVSAESLSETYKPFTPVSAGVSYAMGWAVIDKDGVVTLTHDGGTAGFTSNVSLVPEKQMGVVILMGENQVVPQWLAFRLWEHIRGLPLKDTVKIAFTAAQATTAAQMVAFPDPPEITPITKLQNFTGTFCNAAYGKAIVTLNSTNHLHIKMNLWDVDVKQSAPQQFYIPGQWAAYKFVNFEGGGDLITSLNWALEASMAAPISFDRCN